MFVFCYDIKQSEVQVGGSKIFKLLATTLSGIFVFVILFALYQALWIFHTHSSPPSDYWSSYSAGNIATEPLFIQRKLSLVMQTFVEGKAALETQMFPGKSQIVQMLRPSNKETTERGSVCAAEPSWKLQHADKCISEHLISSRPSAGDKVSQTDVPHAEFLGL